MSNNRPPIALSIAGSEATGGAGAQADLKTFQAHDVFGIIALTCIVSFDPNNNWDHRFVPVEPEVIAQQLEAAFTCYDDLQTVKIGMLGTPATIATVADTVTKRPVERLVVDPVLICKGQEPGAALDTDTALREHILPLATYVTPNLFEAQTLAGMDEISSVDDLVDAAKEIYRRADAAVLAKGGVRLAGTDAVDVFYDGETLEILTEPKIGEHAVSGAGCSLAAAVTAQLANGASPLDAARAAKSFVTRGIEARVSSNAPFDALRQVNL